MVQVASGNPKATLDSFLSQSTFGVNLLNTVLVIWLLRYTLPFSCLKDSALRAAFKLSNQSAVIRGTTWASQTARAIHQELSALVIERLQVSIIFSSPICNHPILLMIFPS